EEAGGGGFRGHRGCESAGSFVGTHRSGLSGRGSDQVSGSSWPGSTRTRRGAETLERAGRRNNSHSAAGFLARFGAGPDGIKPPRPSRGPASLRIPLAILRV